MRFLIDENVDVRVGALLAGTHQVTYARREFGIQTKDPANVAWAKARRAVLVTSDNGLARSLRGSRRCACLHLKDLRTRELDRVRELIAVIESEGTIQAERLWLQIGIDSFMVGR